MEIGKEARVEMQEAYFPSAATRSTESMGGGVLGDPGNEFDMYVGERDMEGEETGVCAQSCATPVPMSSLRAPSPSSTRSPPRGLMSRAGGVGEETTRGATRCANAMCTWLLAGRVIDAAWGSSVGFHVETRGGERALRFVRARLGKLGVSSVVEVGRHPSCITATPRF